MTKETQTQAIAEPFKFKNAALLNRLSEMAQVPYYATACHTLIQAEMAIVELERENATLRAEVERLAAQSAPTEIHADTPRHELLPRLRRLASDFQSHPLSRSISECEEAGIAMAEAAKQIEMLCRTRNTVVNHSGRMRKEIAALTEHRDFLLREIAKIDGDPGNACHYAIEAISAVCADLAEPVPPLPEPEPTYTDKHDKLVEMALDAGFHAGKTISGQRYAYDGAGIDVTKELAAFADAHVASLCADVEQDGFRLVSVNAGFTELMEALDRADRKGYMPDAIYSAYEGFQYRDPASTVAAITAQRDQALARVAELEQDAARGEPVGWQPLATAPKDGKEFIVRYPLQMNCKQLVYWNLIHGFWMSKGVAQMGLGNQQAEWHPLPEDEPLPKETP